MFIKLAEFFFKNMCYDEYKNYFMYVA